jgi:uncharacterized protein YuzE
VRWEYHPESDSAYFYLLEEVGAGQSAAQVHCDAEELAHPIVIDLDREGRVLGFEFPSGAREMLPQDLLDRFH